MIDWLRDRLRERVDIARELRHVGAGVAAMAILLNVLLGVLPVAFLLGTSVMLGRVPEAVATGLGSPAWTALVTSFVLAAIAFVVAQALAPLQAAMGELIARRVDAEFADRLIGDALRTPGIGPLEDQAMLDELGESAQQFEAGVRSPGRACAGLVASLARYVQLVAAVVVVAIVFRWWAGLALFAATMLFRYGQRDGFRRFSKVFHRLAAVERRNNYLRRIGVEPATAKELRVFGIVPWLRERYRESFVEYMTPVWAERRRVYLVPYLVITAIALAVVAGTLAAAGATAADGGLVLRDLALVFQAAIAAINLGCFYPESDVHCEHGMLAYAGMQAFERGLAKYAAPTGTATSAAEPPRREVRFDEVSFAYGGREHAVFDKLVLSIPAGKSTAIVGLNGAGKTTLVKLVGRLYEPDAGRIWIDDTDLATIDVAEWRRRIAVIFQDFNRYPASAADNIAFGAISRAADREAIRTAARRAGILDVIEAMPAGFDTPLSREYAGGVDLSGGQWQRVALARALYALDGGASILILDEPTAALDVRAEAKFFADIVELARGVTTILISHRFSSVRYAENIVVLDGGRVIEQGSHDELLAANGQYATLFRLQAERFEDAA